jgi:hypothetical protein
MTATRNRRKHSASFDERLQRAAREARREAQGLPQGPQRDMWMRKAQRAKTAAHINAWVTLPGLRPAR